MRERLELLNRVAVDHVCYASHSFLCLCCDTRRWTTGHYPTLDPAGGWPSETEIKLSNYWKCLKHSTPLQNSPTSLVGNVNLRIIF